MFNLISTLQIRVEVLKLLWSCQSSKNIFKTHNDLQDQSKQIWGCGPSSYFTSNASAEVSHRWTTAQNFNCNFSLSQTSKTRALAGQRMANTGAGSRVFPDRRHFPLLFSLPSHNAMTTLNSSVINKVPFAAFPPLPVSS